jgi:hypothetical protein
MLLLLLPPEPFMLPAMLLLLDNGPDASLFECCRCSSCVPAWPLVLHLGGLGQPVLHNCVKACDGTGLQWHKSHASKYGTD